MEAANKKTMFIATMPYKTGIAVAVLGIFVECLRLSLSLSLSRVCVCVRALSLSCV
jgi:hypothetical protein